MKSKKAKKSKTISFDEELVPKDVAEKILAENEDSLPEKSPSTAKQSKKKKKHKEQLGEETESVNNNKKKRKLTEMSEDNDTETKQKSLKKEKKKKEEIVASESTSEVDGEEEQDSTNQPQQKKKESIRERKRKRHAKLLEDKKIKAEVGMQQKSLNYLSKWKHSREEWKFEKLRQIWLQNNMYDSTKIPQEFWNVLVEYLTNSKGKSRDVILKKAIKLIEESPEEGDEEIKVQRARDIVQNLQE